MKIHTRYHILTIITLDSTISHNNKPDASLTSISQPLHQNHVSASSTMQLTSLISLIALFVLTTHTLASPLTLTPRGSEEALGNIQYLTTSWKTYTVSLLNISSTYHIPTNRRHSNLPPYPTSQLPQEARYAVIAVVSSYNMNFKYENYVIDRISQGPVLGTNDSRAVVKAIKGLLDNLKPLFEAFETFVDIITKEQLGYMLGQSYQGQVGLLINAVAGVVANRQKDKVERLGRRHDKLVAALGADLGV